jgi:hypothetical protein
METFIFSIYFIALIQMYKINLPHYIIFKMKVKDKTYMG